MQIYKIHNKINGKLYIGKTVKTLNQRWNSHVRMAKKKTNRCLYDAMNKYGYDNFEIISICQASNIKELEQLEKSYIKKFKTLDRAYGYNMTEGGDGGPMPPESLKKMIEKKTGVPLTEEHKQKISKAHMGRPKGPMSDKQKKKLSKALKEKWETDEEYAEKVRSNNQMAGKTGEEHHFFGKKHSRETKKKISQAGIGRKNSEKQKETARKKWQSEGNPNYKYIDTKKLVNLVAQGKSLGEISLEFPLTKQGIRYKILTILKVKSYADAQGAALKWLSSELPTK